MTFKDYWVSIPVPEREGFANKCGTSAGQLHQIAFGFRSANPKLATAIESASGGKVTRKDLFPDDWKSIWPELDQSAA